MQAKPILFAEPMVRALLDGRKTQTRRVVKLPHSNPLGVWEATTIGGGGIYDSRGRKIPHQGALWHTRTGDVIASPFGQPGDLLWVRETWLPRLNNQAAIYRGDWPAIEAAGLAGMYSDRGWRPSIHMPRWASRLTLKITEVRVQRVRDIDGLDALAEGITREEGQAPWRVFWRLWDSLHQDHECFAANPWVWALTFEVLHANVDAVIENRETA